MSQDRASFIPAFHKFLGHKGRGVTVVQAFKPPTNKYVINAKEIIEFTEKHEDKKQLYISVNPAKTGLKDSYFFKEEDVEMVVNIFIDCDAKKEDPNIKNLSKYAATENEYKAVLPAIDIIKAWLIDHGFKVGYYDKTGNGCRFILPITPVDVSNYDKREKWKEQVKELYREIERDTGLELDKSVFDTKRITGIPGTLNRKLETETRKNRIREPGEVPERVEDEKLLKHIEGFEVEWELEKTTDEPKPAATGKAPHTKETAKGNEDALLKLNNLLQKDKKLNDLYAVDFDKYKKEYGYESRSEAELALYIKLLFYEFSDDEIYKILYNAKIEKWKTAKPSYKERTKIRAHLQCCEYTENKTRTYRMNDTGNAQRMNDLFGDDLLYCHGSKEWLGWTGQIWKVDHTGRIIRKAKDSVLVIYEYADSLPDGDFKTKLLKFASTCGSTARLKAMVENLQSEPNIPISMEDMDLNEWILPVQNGTIDLKTGKLRESRREDMCIKLANVVYDPAAKCPEFDKFLKHVLPEEDTRRYIQECLGYALTGVTTEEQLFFLYGLGWNGKNTLLDVIVHILGDYAINIDSKTLLTSDTQTSTTDYEVARLKGARLVTSSEPEKGKTLNDARVKTVTNSCAKITARKLYQEPFDFLPTHKLFFSANFRPYVKDNSNGTWRRIRLIPFDVEITEDNRDANLPSNLKKESSGILNWLIEGCKSWQDAGGLKMCAEVELQTAEYKADMDIVSEFLNTVTVEGNANDTIQNEWLFTSYNTWCLDKGFKEMNYRTFSFAMMERGYKRVKRSDGKHWKGLKLDITKIIEIHERYPLIDYKPLFELYEKMYAKLMAEKQAIETPKTDKTASVTLVTDDDGLVTDKTASVTLVTLLSETLNNSENKSTDKEIIENIKKLVSRINVTSVTDGVLCVTNPSLPSPIVKTENNNGNGSCDKGTKENDELKDHRIYLTIQHKNVIIDEMKSQYEEKTGNLLTGNNLYNFGIFVHKEYDEYQIIDVMKDAKIKYNLGVPA